MHSDPLNKAKDLLMDLVLGSVHPQPESEYIIWWYARQRFVNNQYHPTIKIKKSLRNKAECIVQRLARILKCLLTQEQRNWHLKRKLKYYDDDKVNELITIIKQLRDEKVRKRPNKTVQPNFKPCKKDTAHVQIPIMIEVKVDANCVPDKDKIFNEVTGVLNSSIMENVLRDMRLQPYTSSVTVDDISLHVPKKAGLVNLEGKTKYDPISRSRLKAAIISKFGICKHVVEYKNNVCVVKIPNYRYEGSCGIFIAYEDENGGVGDTGLNFKQVDDDV